MVAEADEAVEEITGVGEAKGGEVCTESKSARVHALLYSREFR